jgi:hypothetical protein
MSALPVGDSSPREEVIEAPDNPLPTDKIKSPLPQDAAFHPSGKLLCLHLYSIQLSNWLSTIVGLGIVPNVDVTALPVSCVLTCLSPASPIVVDVSCIPVTPKIRLLLLTIQSQLLK